MPSPRRCRASDQLRNRMNELFPHRDRGSDGWIADDKHAPWSKHQPNAVGVVLAADFDEDGMPAPWVVERLRQAGAAGDRRLFPGGCLIYEGRITTPDFKRWVPYKGASRHDHHWHVDFNDDPAGHDDASPWLIFEPEDEMERTELEAWRDKQGRNDRDFQNWFYDAFLPAHWATLARIEARLNGADQFEAQATAEAVVAELAERLAKA